MANAGGIAVALVMTIGLALAPRPAYAQTVLGSSIRSWGFNIAGALGDGTNSNNSSSWPVQVLFPAPQSIFDRPGIVTVAGGGFHSLALKADGTVWTWGANAYGQLGNGANVNTNRPVQVLGLSDVVAIAGGRFHSLAVKADGTVWAWGYNISGQLGNHTSTNVNIPVQVSGLSGVTAVAGGGLHSLAMKTDGTVWAWGRNIEGQLGNGTLTIGSNIPVQVPGLTGVIAVAAGFHHSLAVKADGTLQAWGENGAGQLGIGATAYSNTPVQVSGLTGVVAVAAGFRHTLAVKGDGSLWTWGENAAGQLGIGGSTNTNTPVLSRTSIVAAAAGDTYSLAVTADGRVVTWGDYNGQPGRDLNIYVQVFGTVKIAAGCNHSLAVIRPVVAVSPSNLSFATVALGAVSAGQWATIRNDGPDPLIIDSLTISGANPKDFTVVGPPLPIPVAVGSSIVAAVHFAPKAAGARTATLLIGNNGFRSPQSVSLGGGTETVSTNVGETFSNKEDGVSDSGLYPTTWQGTTWDEINTTTDVDWFVLKSDASWSTYVVRVWGVAGPIPINCAVSWIDGTGLTRTHNNQLPGGADCLVSWTSNSARSYKIKIWGINGFASDTIPYMVSISR